MSDRWRIEAMRPGPHPATGDNQEYSSDEWEWMRAVQEYKQRTGRAFPRLQELFGIFARLGYRKAEEDPWEAVPAVRWTATAAGPIERMNRWWTVLTDQPPDEAVGWAPFGRLDRRDRPGSQRAYLRAVEHAEPYERYVRVLAPDGPRWHLARAAPVVGPDGRPARWAGISVDVDALVLGCDLAGRLQP